MSLRKVRQTDNTLYLEDNIDGDDGGKLTLKDSLRDDFCLEEHCENKELQKDVLATVLEKLDARQRQIIILRYGLFGNTPQTQQQVCELLDISRSYVSRIEKRAIEILRENLMENTD